MARRSGHSWPGDPNAAVGLEHHPDFGAAAPTPDHFIPLLHPAGVAAAAGCPAEALIDGYAYGSLSMASYALDAPGPAVSATAGEPASLPDPGLVPPEDTTCESYSPRSTPVAPPGR